jgi:hypothetical protein
MYEVVFQAQKEEIAVLDKMFQDGIEGGYFRFMDSNLAAHAFYGAVHAIGVPMLFQGEKPDLEKLSEEIVDLFLQGIKK